MRVHCGTPPLCAQTSMGLHPIVPKVLKNNKVVLLAGLLGEVRMAADWLRTRLAPTTVHQYPIDAWSPGDAENKPYRWKRWAVMLVSIPPITFAVCPDVVGLRGGREDPRADGTPPPRRHGKWAVVGGAPGWRRCATWGEGGQFACAAVVTPAPPMCPHSCRGASR